MIVRPHRAWLALAAAVLAGCFESDEPLINAADSVTPLADGEYVMRGEDEGRVTVTHAANVMRFTVDDDDGTPETSDVLAAPLGDGFYVLMIQDSPDARYSYALVRGGRSRLVIYDQSDYCDRLQELWLGGGKAAADVGITDISGTRVSTCLFAQYGDVARAFRALIADGRMETVLFIEPVTQD